MPKKEINWETTEVSFYKFVCKDPDILYSYVGHTISFRHRKWQHKASCNNPNDKHYNIPLYIFMREHGGFENWDMVQIHSQFCKNALHAKQIEQEYIEKLQLKLNVYKAYSGVDISSNHPSYQKNYNAKYYESHHTEIAERNAKSYEGHRAERLAYQSKYSKEHFIEKAKYMATYHPKYYEENRVKIAERSAKHYEENRDTINAKARARYALRKAQLNCEILDATNP